MMAGLGNHIHLWTSDSCLSPSAESNAYFLSPTAHLPDLSTHQTASNFLIRDNSLPPSGEAVPAFVLDCQGAPQPSTTAGIITPPAPPPKKNNLEQVEKTDSFWQQLQNKKQTPSAATVCKTRQLPSFPPVGEGGRRSVS